MRGGHRAILLPQSDFSVRSGIHVRARPPVVDAVPSPPSKPEFPVKEEEDKFEIDRLGTARYGAGAFRFFATMRRLTAFDQCIKCEFSQTQERRTAMKVTRHSEEQIIAILKQE